MFRYHGGGMPHSPLLNPLLELGPRRFSFYPAIRNVEHNEWQFRRVTWSEIIVVNTKSGEEAFIPRASIGEISIIDDPVVIVGLRRELEWRDGAIYPHRRPVIEFPPAMAVNDNRPVAAEPSRLAPVVNIRLEPRRATRTSTKLAVAIMLSAVACLVVADIAWDVRHATVRLSSADDYSSIIHKFGRPATERMNGELQSLSYPSRHLTLVLRHSRYIGTLDAGGRILDSVSLPDGATSAPLLRSLPLF
ncbi:MAG: hypothetical protein QOJ99_5151 [Bryobacterales bacterium]|nr:hypothetical protein [Bryobacterales bacterium]